LLEGALRSATAADVHGVNARRRGLNP